MFDNMREPSLIMNTIMERLVKELQVLGTEGFRLDDDDEPIYVELLNIVADDPGEPCYCVPSDLFYCRKKAFNSLN